MVTSTQMWLETTDTKSGLNLLIKRGWEKAHPSIKWFTTRTDRTLSHWRERWTATSCQPQVRTTFGSYHRCTWTWNERLHTALKELTKSARTFYHPQANQAFILCKSKFKKAPWEIKFWRTTPNGSIATCSSVIIHVTETNSTFESKGKSRHPRQVKSAKRNLLTVAHKVWVSKEWTSNS